MANNEDDLNSMFPFFKTITLITFQIKIILIIIVVVIIKTSPYIYQMNTTSNTTVNIGIFWVGAIGSVIASILDQNKNAELFYYNRSEKDIIRILFEENTLQLPITLQNKGSHISLDYLIICLKEHQLIDADHWLSTIIHPNTKVIIIRNGLLLKKPILAYTIDTNILECIINCPTQLTINGAYHQFQKPILTISKSTLSDQFASLFNPSLIQIDLIDDYKTASWKKLIESASLGAILCKHAKTCSIFQDINIQQTYKTLLDEGISVAKANGAIIAPDFASNSFQKIMQYPPNKGSSMLTDRLNNRIIELNAKNGMIEKLGEVYDIDTPIQTQYCNWIRAFNNEIKIKSWLITSQKQ